MKQLTILAIFVLFSLPFAPAAQHPSVLPNPSINETLKEQRVNTFMKTNPLQPSVVLQYTEGTAAMNSTKKEELRMPAAKGTTTVATKRRDSKTMGRTLNLSAKEKMRLGL